MERNRLRRRLRAVVADHGDLLQDDTAYLLGAGPRATALSHAELSEAVVGLLAAAAPSEGS